MASLLTQSVPVALGIFILTSVIVNTRRLTDQQLEVFLILQRLTDDRVYKQWVDLDLILRSLPDDQTKRQKLELLSDMKSSGFLEESAGLWRAVK